ncbi:uncharacterized protein LOC126778231 [Nymphalis io]|uniref:uncharacterized protein LOC126778231 n=1 Tax=Inachis io TaxID=171585 RepID=UPI00216954DB|nr:uncharacterized protein LOC126778231 [Nymphalis io]
MVTSYYIMKMAKNKIYANTDKYFSNIYNAPISKEIIKENSKCRVCLKFGAISIFDMENTNDITEALKLFANIEINENDTFPKCLCHICYQFIKSAVMFRKIAKKTNETLKNQPDINVLCDDWDDPFSDVKFLQNKNNENEFDSLINPTKKEKDKRDLKVQCQTW